jgi:hypothetical protein
MAQRVSAQRAVAQAFKELIDETNGGSARRK